MPITWLDKIDGLDLGDPQKNVNAADMNQIKSTANATETAAAAANSAISTHAALTNNPHLTTKGQVGLANVDNTSDATKLAAALAMFVWGEIPSGAINDVNDTYTITTTAQKLAVYKNGLRQNPSSYTFTPGTNTFVMSVAPETGDTLLTDYQK